MSDLYKIIISLIINAGIKGLPAHIFTLLIIVLIIAAIFFLSVLLYMVLRRVIHALFSAVRKKQGPRIHLEFLERTLTFAVGMFIVISLIGWKNIGGSLLGSAAVITGIVGFAAQDVIKDILSGILISIYKPFDLGDRIELEDGTVGIVESITMRHVVIVRIDTLRVVIPNSRINAASILNYSFGDIQRSCLFRFPVGYDSNIAKTKAVIGDAIKSSPYSVPGKKQKDGSMGYGQVYFIDIADSALIMAVTVYYNSQTASEMLKDDINTRVFEALEENGIDIPYNHTSVIIKPQT